MVLNAWCSKPLVTLWWREGIGYRCLGLITWSCVHQLSFGGDIPPWSISYNVYRSVMPLWTGGMKIFRCLPCRLRPWPCGLFPGAHRLPWPGNFPRTRLPSWGVYSSIQSSGPEKHWLTRILHGLVPHWLVVWSPVGQISYGQLMSCYSVWFPRTSLYIDLIYYPWFYMVSCGSYQIGRQHKGGEGYKLSDLTGYYYPLG